VIYPAHKEVFGHRDLGVRGVAALEDLGGATGGERRPVRGILVMCLFMNYTECDLVYHARVREFVTRGLE
jgi:hypothetical protein